MVPAESANKPLAYIVSTQGKFFRKTICEFCKADK